MARNIILISIAFYIFSCKKNEVEEQFEISGCMDSSSVDYNSSATIDDGSCFYFGCTDISAINYDSVATVDDGNCLYQESIVDGYELFWNDEFNQDSLNMNFWNIEKWSEGAFNEESQRYVNSRENSRGQHPATFPPALPEKCIKVSGIKKGSIVYDPFVGTGTTVVEAVKLGMVGIGTDIDDNFIKFSKKRIGLAN